MELFLVVSELETSVICLFSIFFLWGVGELIRVSEFSGVFSFSCLWYQMYFPKRRVISLSVL